MQRPSSLRHDGHRTRVHTVALAIVFGLLAIIATGPQVPRVQSAVVAVESFLAGR